MTTLDTSLLLVFVLLQLPACVLLVEVLAARLRPIPSTSRLGNGTHCSVTVLIPAHNEEGGIGATLTNLANQIDSHMRVVVVADNCTDSTARIARGFDVEVIERADPDRRGKGYALAFGIEALSRDAPDVVVFLDADCRVERGSLRQLALNAMSRSCPLQAMDLMVAPSGQETSLGVARFAWTVKNVVRPWGLEVMGLPCQLAGTGMAIPWAALSSVDLAGATLAEDLKLGIDLAIAGAEPRFSPDVMVVSEFPLSKTGRVAQQRRWEQGTWRIILAQFPRLVRESLMQRRFRLTMMALDLLVPPIVSYFAIQLILILLAAVLLILGFGGLYLFASVLGTLVLLASLLISWVSFGRDHLPAAEVWRLLTHIAFKGHIYLKFQSWRDRTWYRADRK